MYALVNAIGGFELGKMKRSGRFTKKPKHYKSPIELAKTYSRLDALQRLVIVPVLLNDDGTYVRVEFEYEQD